MCNGVGRLEKGGVREVEVGWGGVGGLGLRKLGSQGGVGELGSGSWDRGFGSGEFGSGLGVPNRDTNPPPDSHHFPNCRPLLHFTCFASSRVARVKCLRVKSSASNFHVPRC